MMAITIRDTSKHEEMLSKLKQQTNTSTMTKALIQGGYDALKYLELFQKERAENERLRSQLYDRDVAVGDFLDSLDNLRNSFSK